MEHSVIVAIPNSIVWYEKSHGIYLVRSNGIGREILLSEMSFEVWKILSNGPISFKDLLAQIKKSVPGTTNIDSVMDKFFQLSIVQRNDKLWNNESN